VNTVVYPAIRQVNRHEFLARLIDTQMEFASDTALPTAHTVLANGPLASAEDLQPGGINHNVARRGVRTQGELQREARLATTHRRVMVQEARRPSSR